MPIITFQGKQYECDSDTPILDSLLARGVNVPCGCRGGICQACMLKATSGKPTELSQTGIEKKLKDKNYFLSCLCKAESDMEVQLPDPSDKYHSSIVYEKEYLNASVVRLRCSRPEGFTYQPGQFVNLMQPEQALVRSYSLASTSDDNFLEFHIRLIHDGRMSNWIADTVENGTFIFVSDAMGSCYYNSACEASPLLLAGTGTGLAPLYGILRNALASGHQQEVYLLHGGLSSEGLYYQEQLQFIAQQRDNFTYQPCVLHGPAPESGVQGSIDEQLRLVLNTRQDWRLFLCGDTEMVNAMRNVCLEHGINESDIHTDSFG
ncbi:CDP-4-dehydro-6-deoxyglucose reductase, E3 [Mariprofundus micogutta]|uniref:CDP-4-dehydro-6-deoxyglucose reductase, E3 n=1 Tax=Mariprofundus micogutta TaxID=1921010 RepID=A0A1L8CQ07_9PROT|nr:2Fe-2S iron-sulfur cluster binding domain-containing protein [Mariprofundus micogutta]GAV21010.1 CDP-4-dehydro-6-deoxyglucose reductase, E3 [Mariprofundus micogutta]